MIPSAFVGADNVWHLRGFCLFDIQKHAVHIVTTTSSIRLSYGFRDLPQTDAGMILGAVAMR
jgi:hypothetical protein